MVYLMLHDPRYRARSTGVRVPPSCCWACLCTAQVGRGGMRRWRGAGRAEVEGLRRAGMG